MHNFLQISSFNDGITTHLKGEVIESYSYNSKKFTKAKGTWRSKLGVYEY